MEKSFRKISGHPIVFITPVLIVILFLSLYPIIWNLLSSFEDRKGLFPSLNQYQRLFNNSEFYNALINTFVWVAAGVALMVIIGFAFALMFNVNFKGRLWFRSIAIVPYAIPAIAVSAVWKWMYNTDYGILNYLLRFIGLTKTNFLWLADPKIVLFAIIIVNTWKMFPFVMLVFLSGLQTIPNDIYESCAIEGAGPIRRLFRITIPLLFPVVRSTLLLLIIWTFNSFTYIYNITRGGPALSSEVLSLYVYRVGIKEFNHPSSAAAAMILFSISLVFTIIFVLVTNKSEENVRK